MGLAVLPARLQEELTLLGEYIVSGKDIRGSQILQKHADWVERFRPGCGDITRENVEAVLQNEVGKVFARVLEDAGVYKCTPQGREAFERFLKSVGFEV